MYSSRSYSVYHQQNQKQNYHHWNLITKKKYPETRRADWYLRLLLFFCYSRNASCALNVMSRFSLRQFVESSNEKHYVRYEYNQSVNITIFTTYTSYTTVSATTVYFHEMNLLGFAVICTARCHTVFTISRIRNKTTFTEI